MLCIRLYQLCLNQVVYNNTIVCYITGCCTYIYIYIYIHIHTHIVYV